MSTATGQPLYDLEAERAMLGSLIINPDALGEVKPTIKPDHFFRESHRLVYRAIANLHTQGKPHNDMVLIRAHIIDKGWADQVAPEGGSVAGELAELQTSGEGGMNAKYYAGLIADKWTKRQIQAVVNDASRDCLNGEAGAEIKDRLIGNLEKIQVARTSEFLPPIPSSRLDETAEPSVEWVWQGYLAKGHSTEFCALWKCGKSTLESILFAAAGTGGHLAGTVAAADILIVSEESKLHWTRRRDRLGFGDNLVFDCRPFGAQQPDLAKWQRYAGHLADQVTQHGYDAVFIDTISAICAIAKENDNGLWHQYLAPLTAITEAGAALLLVHHSGKGDAGEGRVSRGGSALCGFVDVILEMRRLAPDDHEDRRRVLTAYSRFDETPREQVIELDGDGKSYRTIGDKGQAIRTEMVQTIESVLPKGEPGLKPTEILSEWPTDRKPAKRTLYRALEEGFKLGAFCRTVEGNSHRYWTQF